MSTNGTQVNTISMSAGTDPVKEIVERVSSDIRIAIRQALMAEINAAKAPKEHTCESVIAWLTDEKNSEKLVELLIDKDEASPGARAYVHLLDAIHSDKKGIEEHLAYACEKGGDTRAAQGAVREYVQEHMGEEYMDDYSDEIREYVYEGIRESVMEEVNDSPEDYLSDYTLESIREECISSMRRAYDALSDWV